MNKNPCDTALSNEYFKLRSKKVQFDSCSKKNHLNSSRSHSQDRKGDLKTENEFFKKEKNNFGSSRNVSNEFQPETTCKSDNLTLFDVSNENNKVTLKDLCAEDKAKIGELIKKLAAEKQEKEDLLRLMEERQREYEQSLGALSQESKDMALESLEIKEKFRYSLNLLKKMKEDKQENQRPGNQQRTTKSEFQNVDTNNLTPVKDSPLKELLSSPKEFLKINRGETRKKLEEIYIKKGLTQEEKEFNEYEEKLAQSHKTINEISKLKDDIDSLASSLKTLEIVSPQKTFKQVEQKSNNMKQENLSSTIPKFSQKKPPINIIENKNESESSLSSDESESELAEKWLKAKQKKLQELNMQIKNEKKLEEKNDNHKKDKNHHKSKKKKEESCENNRKISTKEEAQDNDKPTKIEITKENLRKDESSQERTHRSKKSKSKEKKINISERNFTFQKNETNTSEERESSKDRKFKIENLQTSYEKKVNLTAFNKNDISSFRNYLDRKIEDLNPTNQKPATQEHSITSEISTPQPQKNVKKPYDLNEEKENNMITADNNEEILKSFANFLNENTKFKTDKGNMINFLTNNQDKLLESKIKEFLSIKDRILDKSFNKSHIDESSNDGPKQEEKQSKKQKNKKRAKPFDKESKENINNSNILEEQPHNLPPKKQMTPKMRENELDEMHLNTLKKSNLNLTTSNKNEYLFTSIPSNLTGVPKKNLFSSLKQNEQNFEELDTINNLLNKTEDFYENDLLSIIQEVEKEEMKRKEDKKIYLRKEKHERGAQKPNQSSSYIDSDASLRYINQQIAEMERKKGGYTSFK